MSDGSGHQALLAIGLLCLGFAAGLAAGVPVPELVATGFGTRSTSAAAGAAATGGCALALWATDRSGHAV